MVGEGPDQEKLKRYVEERNIENVYFEGRQQNVLSYYQKASFICLTSNTEGFGMTLIEGMSQGCIPFSFNNFAAANDIIIDGENGCLIKPFNIKEYANKLKNLMNDSEKRIDEMEQPDYEFPRRFSKTDYIVTVTVAFICLALIIAGIYMVLERNNEKQQRQEISEI